jgi:hypothetical protein
MRKRALFGRVDQKRRASQAKWTGSQGSSPEKEHDQRLPTTPLTNASPGKPPTFFSMLSSNVFVGIAIDTEASGLDSIGGLNLNGWTQQKPEIDSNTPQDEPSAHSDTQGTDTAVTIAPQ